MRSMKLVLVACLLGAGIATACASQGEEAQVAVQDHERVLLQRDGYAATLSMVRDQPDTLVVTGRGIRATFRVHRSGNVALASTSAGDAATYDMLRAAAEAFGTDTSLIAGDGSNVRKQSTGGGGGGSGGGDGSDSNNDTSDGEEPGSDGDDPMDPEDPDNEDDSDDAKEDGSSGSSGKGSSGSSGKGSSGGSSGSSGAPKAPKPTTPKTKDTCPAPPKLPAPTSTPTAVDAGADARDRKAGGGSVYHGGTVCDPEGQGWTQLNALLAKLMLDAVLNGKANAGTNFACWGDVRKARNVAAARLSKCCKAQDPASASPHCKAIAAHFAPSPLP